jgi:TFIIF-interacting CTD phosphatase-like protein
MLSRRTCIRMRSAATGDIMYVKDLCALGRDLGRTFLVDNTPHGKPNHKTLCICVLTINPVCLSASRSCNP